MAAALGPTALGRFLWAAFQSLWAFWGGVGDFRSVKRRLRGGIRGASRDVRSAKWRHEGVRSAGGCEGGRTKWRRFGDQNGGRGGVSSGVGGRGDPHPEAATAELRPGEGRSVRPAPEGAVRAPPCPRRCAGGGCCCWGSPGGGTGCAEPPPPIPLLAICGPPPLTLSSPSAPLRRTAAALRAAESGPRAAGRGRPWKRPRGGDPHPHRAARGPRPSRPGAAQHPAPRGRAVGVRPGTPLPPFRPPPPPPNAPRCPRRLRSAVVARVNGELRDLERPLQSDAELELLDFTAPEGRAVSVTEPGRPPALPVSPQLPLCPHSAPQRSPRHSTSKAGKDPQVGPQPLPTGLTNPRPHCVPHSPPTPPAIPGIPHPPYF